MLTVAVTIAAILLLTLSLYLTTKIKWFAIIPLAVLTTYAFLKRVLFLGDKCFWWDEFLTEQRVWYTDQEIFEYPMTARAVIYSFILKFYASLISTFTHNNFLTEFQLRLPHAIAGTLAIIVIYKIGKQIKDQFTGLIMAFLAAFSTFLIIYAREARYYPFVLLFSACLIHAVALIIYRPDNKRALLYYAYYSIAAILGMHTHQGFWLLFAASNVFLVIFELQSLVFRSKDQKFDPVFLIEVFWLLTLPVVTAYFCIDSLFGKGMNSDIIKAEKLVPSLDLAFFKSVHQELWQGLRSGQYFHFIALPAALFLLIPKKTRALSLYLLTVAIVTFLALRNMGTFKEPFRVKYITFLWLIEAIGVVLALANMLDLILKKVKKQNLKTGIYCFALAFLAAISLEDAPDAFSLPRREDLKESYRTLTKKLNDLIQPKDIVVSYEEGLEALQYYKRVYASDWKIIGAHQIESQYSGNYIYDGFAYCLFHRNTAKASGNEVVERIADSAGYSLYRTKKPLDRSLQNNLLITIVDGFREKNDLPVRKSVDRLYFTDNYLKNGDFSNGLNYWDTSEINEDYMSIAVLAANDTTYLSVTNNYSVALVLSQTIDIPEEGVYALTFKTHGFYNGGHFTIKSDDVNIDIYRAEITNPMFPRFHNLTFKKPQKVKFHVTVKPEGCAALYDFGFYKLEKR
ncbi:glycosyltransferase family 39 protein [bacterium]|nr:glycosyltransferase family 39 protein [bacterium]